MHMTGLTTQLAVGLAKRDGEDDFYVLLLSGDSHSTLHPEAAKELAMDLYRAAERITPTNGKKKK
jgi:hypothetical protein